MNIREFIESGILESYVLGNATESERQQVEAMAMQYPDVRRELSNLEKTMEEYALLKSVNPPAGLKDKILSRINDDSGKGKIIPMDNSQKPVQPGFKWLAAASIALLVLSMFGNYYLYSNLQTQKNENQKLAESAGAVQQQFETSQQLVTDAHQKIKFLADLYSKKVLLKGIENHPGMAITVFWNEKTSELSLMVNNLPKPEKGKQFQLWALYNGQPIDAGVFHVNDSLQMQKMKLIENANAFAVTLENEGGSPSPTLDQMYAMGNF